MQRGDSTPLDLDRVRSLLRTDLLGLGVLEWHAELPSTQDRLRELAAAGAPHGSVVGAEHQTAGRGRRGRCWASPPGSGLYVSVLLQAPPVGIPFTLLSTVAAVAACRAIHEAGDCPVEIKWPNDLLLDHRKLGGILIEATTRDGVPIASAGFGINVNTAPQALPERPLFPATSLRAVAGRSFSREPILAALLNTLEEEWCALRSACDAHRLAGRWLACAGGPGRRVAIDIDGIRHEGTLEGISGEGALLLRDRDGKQQSFLSGDVVRWDPAMDGA